MAGLLGPPCCAGGPQQFFLEHARVALTTAPTSAACGGHVRLNFATSGPILDEILERMATAVRRR